MITFDANHERTKTPQSTAILFDGNYIGFIFRHTSCTGKCAGYVAYEGGSGTGRRLRGRNGNVIRRSQSYLDITSDVARYVK